MIEPLSNEAKKAVAFARKESDRVGSSYIGVEHLFIGLSCVEDAKIADLFNKVGIGTEDLRSILEKYVDCKDESERKDRRFTNTFKRVLMRAFSVVNSYGQNVISCEGFLLALIGLVEDDLEDSEDCLILKNIFKDLTSKDVNIVKELRFGAVRLLRNEDSEKSEESSSERDSAGSTSGTSQTKKTSSNTRELDKYCRDLTKLAREGKLDPLIGREKEIERVIMILSRRNKCNPVLVGEPGVGKTAVVEGLAQRIVSGDVPERLKNVRLCSLSLSGVIGGTHYRGDFEERINKIVKELTDCKPRVILFIDEIHTLVGAGGSEGGVDASSALKPALARGDFQCIGATTPGEYTKYIEKDPALERRFHTVDVVEPTEEESINILRGLRPYYERHHGVDISDEAIKEAVSLSNRFITERLLPDKAIDVIDEACSSASLYRSQKPKEIFAQENEIRTLTAQREESLQNGNYGEAEEIQRAIDLSRQKLERLNEEWREKQGHSVKSEERPCVDVDKIAYVVSLVSGVPIQKITEDESARLVAMEDILHQRVIGQDEPVKVISKAIKRARAGLKDPNKPIGSFLFLGPTGVGKTELARTLANFLFNDESAMIRLDMSEYSEKFSVSRLYGAAPGYVGYEEGGELTDAVRRKPYSVVLFDEIEKAHPDIFNVLLQILDEGRLTDSKRHVVDFKNVVVVMTSNIGFIGAESGSGLGFRGNRDEGDSKVRFERMKRRVLEEVKKVFKPEFLNRLDAQVVFHSLENEHLLQIVDIMLGKVKDGLKHTHRDIELTLDAKRALVASCDEPQYGARPLRRAIQTMLEDPLSERVLTGEFPENSTMLVDLSEDGKAELDAREAEDLLGKRNKKNALEDEEGLLEFVFSLKV